MNAMLRMLLLFLLFFLTSCEKYVGYNLDAEPLPVTVRISGSVRDFYTNQPLEGVRVRFGDYQTSTDQSGFYQLDYPYGTDEERNKPVELLVILKKYLPFHESVILPPITYIRDFRLVRGAPIIQKVVLPPFTTNSGRQIYVCQAQVKDYQGVVDIQLVEALVYYQFPGNPHLSKYRKELTLVYELSDTTAYYEGIFPPFLSDGSTIYRRYEIYAVNRSGLADTLVALRSPTQPDTFLFTPVLDDTIPEIVP